MALYAIGDVQGCHTELCQLLELIAFSPDRDRLWLVGDLVNRGPDSLAVLREVKALGNAAVTVLGNHDFHLLTVAHGLRPPHREDTLQAILDAPDRDELVHWLQRRPLVVVEGNRLLVHAGLLPQWTPNQALALSKEVETMLAGSAAVEFLANLYGDEPRTWREDLQGYDRLRVIVNAFARLRFCADDGTMNLREKRGPAHAPEGMKPWYAHAHRASASVHVVCGHWSTLGLMLAPNVSMLDSGCLWGGALTAMRLEANDDANGDARRIYQVPSRTPVTPLPPE